MLRIDKIDLININSISNLSIKFQNGVNILCGTNGVGKTTILECLAISINGRPFYRIKNSVSSFSGQINTTLIHNDSIIRKCIDVYPDNSFGFARISDEMIYYNISHRSTSRRHPFDLDRVRIMSPLDAIIMWFYRNYYEDENLSNAKSNNLQIVNQIFNRIDQNIFFSELQITTQKRKTSFNEERNEEYRSVTLLVKTPHGIIDFNDLSSGYKACFTILLDIIRYVEKLHKIEVRDFSGVVLIDEIDQHLHPEWQSKIVSIIKWLIPNAQLIFTTHSPHVIQSAQSGEIIPLGVDENNNIYIRDLPESQKYGYQGWTIEEILVHVMGLSNPMSKIFQEKLKMFEKGLAEDDPLLVRENFYALKSMLFSKNPLLALLRIQAAEYMEDE
ncbi:AAA family ATPase [Paenibacillus taichungensis]